MRRSWLILALTVAVAGCEVFRAHPEAAAEAAGIKLPPTQLAVMMASVKGIKDTRLGGQFASRLWVDYTLVTNLVASKAGYTDSSFIADVMWADITELRGVRWHDSLVSIRGGLRPGMVEAAFKAGDARELQHILIRADSGSPDSVMRIARKRADSVLGVLKRGADFGKLAAQVSDDPGSKFKSGILPIEPKGRWARQFDEVGWALAPGQMSGVFQTRFGYHIMRRPTFAESEDAFRQYMLRKASAQVDSIYFDSLPKRWNLEVTPQAGDVIRQAMANPEEIKDSNAVLATYRGGNLQLSTLLRWANALPIQFTERLGGQADSGLVRFVDVIGQNVLLIKEADSAGIRLTAEDWADLKSRYLTGMDSLTTALEINGKGFADSAANPALRDRLVASRVDSLFNRSSNTGKRLPTIPFQLATVLRARYPHRLYTSGIDEALTLIRQMNPDSASAAQKARSKQAAASATPAMVPPSGPPPVAGAKP